MRRSARALTLQSFLERLHGVQRQGEGHLAFCPFHRDRGNRSLSINASGGKILVHCFAGCTAEEIVTALNLTLADLFTRRPRPSVSSRYLRRAQGRGREGEEALTERSPKP